MTAPELLVAGMVRSHAERQGGSQAALADFAVLLALRAFSGGASLSEAYGEAHRFLERCRPITPAAGRPEFALSA